MRAAYLERNPWCKWPGCPARATVVDHIDGEGPLGARGYDPTNHQGLCRSHHWVKTLRFDGGMGNPRLPASERPPGWTGLGDEVAA